MNIKKAISLARGSDEKRVGFNLQIPAILKSEFEHFCKDNGVKVTTMILALMQTMVDEVKEKEALISEIEKDIALLDNQRDILQRVYDESGLTELKLEDGSIKYIKKDLDSLNLKIKSLENDLGYLMSMEGGIER